MNACEAGHKAHNKKRVMTSLGFPMYVYSWEKYKDVEGYCTGKDDFSRTILNGETWEKEETTLAKEILGTTDGLVLDFGAHLGWYSLLAAHLNHKVIAFEGDQENVFTMNENRRLCGNHVASLVETRFIWINHTFHFETDEPIALLKSDLEGLDKFAVHGCQMLFKSKQIKYALIEISPVFDERASELVDRIVGYGYEIKDIVGDPERQANYLFKAK